MSPEEEKKEREERGKRGGREREEREQRGKREGREGREGRGVQQFTSCLLRHATIHMLAACEQRFTAGHSLMQHHDAPGSEVA